MKTNTISKSETIQSESSTQDNAATTPANSTTALPVTIITDKRTFHFPAEVAGDFRAFRYALRDILKDDPHAFDCLDEVSNPNRKGAIERVMLAYNVNHNSALSSEQTTIDYRNQPAHINDPKVFDIEDFYVVGEDGTVSL